MTIYMIYSKKWVGDARKHRHFELLGIRSFFVKIKLAHVYLRFLDFKSSP